MLFIIIASVSISRLEKASSRIRILGLPKGVACSVNGRPITQTKVDETVDAVLAEQTQGRPIPPEMIAQLRERMVEQVMTALIADELLNEDADKAQISATEEELVQEMEKAVRSHLVPTKETPRDRVLSSTEIAAFWHGLEKASMLPLTRLALKLMLVTAQRRDEVAHIRWLDINLEERLWTLPRELTKSDRAHEVPLPVLAIEILDSIPKFESDYVFASRAAADPVAAPTTCRAADRGSLRRQAKGRAACD